MRNTLTQPRRKRREDKIDWETLQHAPNVDGMLSYLQRPGGENTIASGAGVLIPVDNGVGNTSREQQIDGSEALGSDLHSHETNHNEVKALEPVERPLPRFTRTAKFAGVGKRRLHRCALVQDAHSPGEQVVLNSLYRMAKSPRWGRPQVDGSFLVSAGLRDIAEQTCMHETNVRFNLRSLIEKLAIEIVEDEDRKRQTARVYHVFSYKEILERRRARGLEWVIKNRGVRFISKEKVEEILASETLPSDFTDETDALPSVPHPQRASESLEARPSGSPPLLLGNTTLENSFQETSSSLPPEVLIKGLHGLVPIVDEEAVTSLWDECRMRAGDCTAEEVLYFAKEKSLITRNGKIQNPLGFLLTAVPKCFEGQVFTTFRAEQRKKAEEQRRLEVDQQKTARLQEEQIAREAEAYRKAEDKLESLPKHEYADLFESTKEKLLKDHPQVRSYPAAEFEKLVRRRILTNLQERELRNVILAAKSGGNL